MVVAPKAGEAPVKPIDVWANQTQKSASLLGLDSPLFGATTIRVLRWQPPTAANNVKANGAQIFDRKPTFFTHYIARWQRVGPLATDHSQGHT